MSQVQFSGSCSQDSNAQGRKSEVPETQFQGPWCQESRVPGFRVPRLRVPESQVPGSQGPVFWVQSLRVPGPRSKVLILDYFITEV